MAVRVLVVDDSGFFRRRLGEILGADPRLEVVGGAADGKQAIEQAQSLRPDVITMDIEMPVMDGITAVREIMRRRPTPILMLSSLTFEGAQATLKAIEAGAVDFMPKRFEDIARDREEGKRAICDRVVAIARRGSGSAARTVPPPTSTNHTASYQSPYGPRTPQSPQPPRPSPPPRAVTPQAAPLQSTVRRRGHYQLLAIGTSTGGPVALQEVLTRLPATFPLPLVLIQHMPANFTKAFAQRLNQLCPLDVREAEDGDEVRQGRALLAPGGKQMVLERVGGRVVVRIQESPPEQHYRPCVDTTFRSLASTFPGRVLAVVLTGMGADGREGARQLKSGGSTIWAQDEATSVVYGMPMAIRDAGLADRILALPDIATALNDTV